LWRAHGRSQFPAIHRNLPQKRCESPQTPQISQIGDKSLFDQIFGGAKIPPPFRVLKLIVDQNLGGHSPLSHLKTFFWFLPDHAQQVYILCMYVVNAAKINPAKMGRTKLKELLERKPKFCKRSSH
jgi:hypothetical protein